MADNVVDKEIVDLPESTGVTGDTVFPGYVPGALNPAQKITAEQLKEYFGQEVFVATCNVTTYAEVKEAYDAGKVLLCRNPQAGYFGLLSFITDEAATFSSIHADTKKSMTVWAFGKWDIGFLKLERESDKVTSIDNSSTDTQYPSAKAVYEFGKSLTIEGGEDGKSAYEYAQDGGYTGTEEEFSEKLAQPIPPDLTEEVNQLFEDKVGVTAQTFTEEQKTQARKNIGIDSLVVRWNDLTGKPFTDASEVLFPETENDSMDMMGYYGWFLPAPYLSLTVGDEYIVRFDGVDYECVVKKENNDVGLGNFSLAYNYDTGYSYPDTGEPFFVELFTVRTKEPGTYTFGISKKKGEVIDEECIPDTIARVNDIAWDNLPDRPFGEIVRPLYVLEETECTTDAEAMVDGVFAGEIAVGECPFGPGDFYTVNFDGVDYTCMADGDLNNTWIGNLALVGNESDTGEPFCLLALNAGGSISLFTKTKGIHSLSVAVADSTVSEVKQLDEKYIPDTIARTSELTEAVSQLSEEKVGVTPQTLTEEQKAQARANIGAASGGNADYELPIATPETLGGVKPVAKGADMTQEVGVDELGGLWTAPGVADGWDVHGYFNMPEVLDSGFEITEIDGKPLQLKEIWAIVKLQNGSTSSQWLGCSILNDSNVSFTDASASNGGADVASEGYAYFTYHGFVVGNGRAFVECTTNKTAHYGGGGVLQRYTNPAWLNNWHGYSEIRYFKGIKCGNKLGSGTPQGRGTEVEIWGRSV